MKKVTEVRAINGPYPGPYSPTEDGIRNAIEACLYDQQLGVNDANDRIIVVFEDGETKECAVSDTNEDIAYSAAAIAHELGIDHDSSVCAECGFK